MAYQTVIIRGFQGKPSIGLALGSTEARVSVVNPDSLARVQSGETAPLMILRQDVFEFDADLFQRLMDEWKDKGETQPRAWRALRQWDGAHAEA